MAIGDITASSLGVFSISGADLTTALGTMNSGSSYLSGQNIYIIPTANGQQVQIIKTVPANW